MLQLLDFLLAQRMAHKMTAIIVFLAVPLTAGAASCLEANYADIAKNNFVGYVGVQAVTQVLPGSGDARILYASTMSDNLSQRFRVFDLTTKASPQVFSLEKTPVKSIDGFLAKNDGFTAENSVLLHLDIQAMARTLWRTHELIVVECGLNGSLQSWGQLRVQISSPYVAWLCLPVALVCFMLAMWAVYKSREETAERLIAKYPAVFGAKKFRGMDFLNPIQLTANPFNEASVQKLQVLMFSFLVGCLVLSLALRTGALTDLSLTVVALLGISGVGAVASQITYTSKTRLSAINWSWLQAHEILGPKSARAPQWKDLVLTNREFDVYKLQTIIFSLAVAAALLVAGATHLAAFAIPDTMLGILGLSQAVFVGGILVRPPATIDLDKSLTDLRAAAKRCVIIPPPAGTTPIPDIPAQAPAQDAHHPAALAAYYQLAEELIPMIESTLEAEVDRPNLLDAWKRPKLSYPTINGAFAGL